MRRSVSLYLLIFLLIIMSIFNNESTAKYIKAFDKVSQIIVAAPWDIDLKIECDDKNVNLQILDGFKRGDVKSNLIKLTNENEYGVKFYLEVYAEGIDEENNIFLNPNIIIDIYPIENTESAINAPKKWCDIYSDNLKRTYKYEAEILPKSYLELDFNVIWNSDDINSEIYKGKGGKLTYVVKAEQIID